MLAVYMEKGYTMSVLEIKNLHVSVEDKEILKGLNLTLKTGEIAAIKGHNGTGKSTLSAAIMGNPNYEITEENLHAIVQKEIGFVFAKVLECAGVYKRTPEGQAAFKKFLECI